MINGRDTSIVWDDQFEADRHADAVFQNALAEEGFEAFLDKD